MATRLTDPPRAGFDLETLGRVQDRVLWLAISMVHHANHVRQTPSGVKVGGHQASSASMASVWSALAHRYVAGHFEVERGGRHIALLGDAELDEGACWGDRRSGRAA